MICEYQAGLMTDVSLPAPKRPELHTQSFETQQNSGFSQVPDPNPWVPVTKLGFSSLMLVPRWENTMMMINTTAICQVCQSPHQLPGPLLIILSLFVPSRIHELEPFVLSPVSSPSRTRYASPSSVPSQPTYLYMAPDLNSVPPSPRPRGPSVTAMASTTAAAGSGGTGALAEPHHHHHRPPSASPSLSRRVSQNLSMGPPQPPHVGVGFGVGAADNTGVGTGPGEQARAALSIR
jgi:hypothetical protein